MRHHVESSIVEHLLSILFRRYESLFAILFYRLLSRGPYCQQVSIIPMLLLFSKYFLV